MNQVLLTIDEVNQKIQAGKNLLLAGDENVLAKLEKGSWIAGTIPYFVAQNGGEFNQEKIFVTELPDYVSSTTIKVYDDTTIHSIYADAPEHGFVVTIIPATSKTHLAFSLKAPEFPEFATRPVVGWIAGVFLDDLGKIAPKVFNGSDGSVLENAAVTMNVNLPQDKIAQLGIVNIFEQGDGDTLVFPEDGFSATDVAVNGKTVKLADYIKENNIDTKSPMVADFYGANINISFQQIVEEEKRVDFYGPVFKGIEYKLAKSVADYANEFKNMIPELGDTVAFSCNCILNYLYGELEGKKTIGMTGPITFGEIAYQLLNQTLVYLTINDK